VAADNDFLNTFISTQSAYHDHKEQVAYVIAGLFLGGATWVGAGSYTFSQDLRAAAWEQVVLLVLVVVAGWYGWQMFRWQLAAAIHVAAGYTLAGRWLRYAPTPEDLVPQAGSTPEWPTALCQEIARIRHQPGLLGVSLGQVEFWTCALLVVFWLAALARVLQKAGALRECVLRLLT